MNPKLRKIIILIVVIIILVLAYVAYNGELPGLVHVTAKTLNNNSFASIFGLVAAALIAGWFGFSQYRKQKDYEEIKSHYLNSIDDLLIELHKRRIISENNFTHALQTLQYFRDAPPDLLKKWQESNLFNRERIPTHMPQSFFICAQLFQNEVFNKITINVIANMAHVNDYFVTELPLTLSTLFERNPENYKAREQRKVLADQLQEALMKKNKLLIIAKVYELLTVIESISFIAKKLNIDTYDKLNKFNENPEIIAKLNEIGVLWQNSEAEAALNALAS